MIQKTGASSQVVLYVCVVHE